MPCVFMKYLEFEHLIGLSFFKFRAKKTLGYPCGIFQKNQKMNATYPFKNAVTKHFSITLTVLSSIH